MNGTRAPLTWASRPIEWSSVFSEMYDKACNVNKWPEGGSGSLLCVSVFSFVKQNHKGTWPTDFCEDFTSEQSSESTWSKNSARVLCSLFSSFYWQRPRVFCRMPVKSGVTEASGLPFSGGTHLARRQRYGEKLSHACDFSPRIVSLGASSCILPQLDSHLTRQLPCTDHL